MKVIFSNPITKIYEVGIIVRKYLINKRQKFDVISEKGSMYLALSTNVQKNGHIDEILSKKFADSINTNLTKLTQANYKDSEYIPNILKVNI
jgi:hypothetical protein